MSHIARLLTAGPAAVGAAAALPPAAAAANVGLELALLVDVSGSVNANEYNLQMQGYRQAFGSAAVQSAIANNPTGSIAVAVVQWSGSNQQQLSIGWTQVTAANAAAFGDRIGSLQRAFAGNTAPGNALAFVLPSFATNGFDAPRQVIDVSGDGAQNNGISTSAARDAALAGGVDTINGVVILGEAGLRDFYVSNIQAGPGGFVLAASGFADFATVIENKLEREISAPTGVPAPAGAPLLGLGLLGLGLARGASRRPR